VTIAGVAGQNNGVARSPVQQHLAGRGGCWQHGRQFVVALIAALQPTARNCTDIAVSAASCKHEQVVRT